jgi:ribulose-bisphosphate carboxylase large chain
MSAPQSFPEPSEKPRSRVLRFEPGFHWQGVPVREYKQQAEHHCGVVRTTLVGAGGEHTSFQVRYFEIEPGGFSSFEHHAHEHAVIVLRGRGLVQLGEQVHEVGFGDAVYVAPHEPHQFRNPSDSEPFGFLCVVDAERDRPVPLTRS